MKNKCPCVNCVCVPICQNKMWSDLITSCVFIAEYFRELESNIPPNHSANVDLDSLNQSYRICKTINGTITWSVFHNGVARVTSFYPPPQEG